MIPKDPIEGAFLYVRGTGSFLHPRSKEGATALIRAVGAKDLATEKGINGVTPANAEALAKLNPEVIFTMSGGLESTEGLKVYLPVRELPKREQAKNSESLQSQMGCRCLSARRPPRHCWQLHEHFTVSLSKRRNE